MDAGDLLKAARVRAGLSPSELAIAAETAQPAISAYECGHRDPSAEAGGLRAAHPE